MANLESASAKLFDQPPLTGIATLRPKIGHSCFASLLASPQ